MRIRVVFGTLWLFYPACTPNSQATASGTDGASETASETDGDTDDAPCPQGVCTPGQLLVEPTLLMEVLVDDPSSETWRVLDLRDREKYEAGHIPGAYWLDPSLLRAEVDGIPGQVAGLDQVAGVLAERNVDATVEVVAVDDGTGLAAARTVWTLGYYGLSGRVLHGGYPGWVEASGEVSIVEPTSTSNPPPPLSITGGLRVDAQWVQDHLDDPGLTLVDARSPEEFEAGHIPGAHSLPWEATKNGTRFLSSGELRDLYTSTGVLPEASPEQIFVAYCQTGTRASVTWLTLKLLGYTNVLIYDGSWAEWSLLRSR